MPHLRWRRRLRMELCGRSGCFAIDAGRRSRKDRVELRQLDLVHRDMRALNLGRNLGRRFTLVIVSCNALAHLHSQRDLAPCLGAVDMDVDAAPMRRLTQLADRQPQAADV